MHNDDTFLWVEKYRPKTIDECILPDHLKRVFKEHIKNGQIPNLILTGTPGVGKTTAAIAMAQEIDSDWILINGSVDNGIDVLRTTIMSFGSSVSLMGGRKIIIIDEADNLSADAQKGFRGVIEEFANNCTFIFTCNFPSRILHALPSRCPVIDFKLTGDDKARMASQFLKRVEEILTLENIKYDQKTLVALIMKFFPDYRRVLNELQIYAINGNIDIGILAQLSSLHLDELIKHLKAKDFKSIRQWVGVNSHTDTNTLFRSIYDRAIEIVTPNSIPVIIVLLGKYQMQAAWVVDQEINTMAFLTELICEAEFK